MAASEIDVAMPGAAAGREAEQSRMNEVCVSKNRAGVRRALPAWPALSVDRGWLFAAAALAVAVGGAYANSLTGEMVLDNGTIINQDTRIRACTLANAKLILERNYWWPSWESDLFRPLTTFTYMFNYSVLGNELRPCGYHVFNLALHWMNALFTYGLALRLLRRRYAALAVAAIFAVHPLTTEAVTNIVGRADLLVAFFLLIAMNLFIRYHATGRGLTIWAALGLLLSSLAAIFSKESGVVLIGLMLVYDLVYFGRKAGDSFWKTLADRLRAGAWKPYLCVLPAVVLLFWIRHRLLMASPTFGQLASDNPIVLADFWTGRMTAIRVIGDYLGLVFWPAEMSCDYSYPQIPLFGWSWTGGDWIGWLTLGLIIGLLVFTVCAWKTQRAAIFFLGLAGVTFLPVSNLLIVVGSIMGERFMYMPLIGILGALTAVGLWLWRRLAARRPVVGRFAPLVGWGVSIALVVAFGWRTYLRNQDWQNETLLWASAARTCPASFKVYKGQGTTIAKTNPDIPNLERAIAFGEQAAAILDARPLPLIYMPNGVWLDLGRFYGKRAEMAAAAGETRSAQIAWYKKALYNLERAAEIDRAVNQQSRETRLARTQTPEGIFDVGQPEIYNTLALVQVGLQNEPAAREAARYQIRLEPSKPQVYLTSALVNLASHRFEDAAVDYLSAMILGQVSTDAWSYLNRYFDQIAPQPPAVIWTDKGASLNVLNPAARNLVDRACRRVVEGFLESNRPALAREAAQTLATRYNCKEDLFSDLFSQTRRDEPIFKP